MKIIIYRLETMDNKPIFVEKGRWLDGEFSGGLENHLDVTKEEVINEFNRGYYRTSEVKEETITEKIEFDLNKAKQRVYVKPTAQKKGYYRTQEVGQKEIEKKPPRKDTGKIAALPDEIKKEILDLRRLGDSGTSIKSSIENMIDASNDSNIKYDLHGKGILKNPSGAASLNVTGQSLVDWAKARGVESRKKRKTVKVAEAEAKEIGEKQFKLANEKLAQLQVENKKLQDQLASEKKSHADSNEIRAKLRDENYILREKLKSLK